MRIHSSTPLLRGGTPVSTLVYDAYVKLPVIDVRAYGAKGDGTTDDTAAIIAGVAATAVNGGVLFFAPLTYLASETIYIPSNVTLQGSGIGATTIKWANGSNCHCIRNSDDVGGNVNITIRDMTLDFNGANQTADVHGIRIYNTDAFTLDNCRLQNSYHHNLVTQDDCGKLYILNTISKDSGKGAGISGCCLMAQGALVIFDNCYTSGGSYHGIQIYGGNAKAIISNCRMVDAGASGLEIDAGNVDVVNVQITGAGVSGMAINTANSVKVRARNLYVYGSTQDGIYINELSGASFIRDFDIEAHCEANGRHGANLNRAVRGTLRGTYKNNVSNGVNLATSLYNTISVRAYDNQAPKTQNYGVYEGAGCDYNIYKGCDLIANATRSGTFVGEHNVFDQAVTSVEMDLSNAAENFTVFQAISPCFLAGLQVAWTEAAGDANTCVIRVGEIDAAGLDDNHFHDYTTAGSEAVGDNTYVATASLAGREIAPGSVVTVGHTQKTGAGKVVVTLQILEMGDVT